MKRSLLVGITLLVVFAMVVGANMVVFLSNKITAEIDVESPFEIDVCNSDEWVWSAGSPADDFEANGEWNEGDLGSLGVVSAGSTGVFYARIKNTANENLTGTAKLTLESSKALTFDATSGNCKEITRIEIIDLWACHPDTGNEINYALSSPVKIWGTQGISAKHADFNWNLGINGDDKVYAGNTYVVKVIVYTDKYADPDATYDLSLQII